MELTATQRMAVIQEMSRRGMDVSKYTRGPAPGAPGDFMSSPKYVNKRAELQAKADDAAFETAGQGLQEAMNNQTQIDMLRETVAQAPTGSFAGRRKDIGKNVGNLLGWVPGVPTYEQATALENLETLKSERTLSDVSKLKGPLSDKDVNFLSKLQVDPYATAAHNKFVVQAQDWANKRQAAYNAGLREWSRRLGSPRATNANGQDFLAWWGDYSTKALPRPSATALTPRQQSNADLRARSAAKPAAGGGIKVLEVIDD